MPDYRHKTRGFVTGEGNYLEKVNEGTWQASDFEPVVEPEPAPPAPPAPELPPELAEKLDVNLAGEGLAPQVEEEIVIDEDTVASGATERDVSRKDKPRRRR